MGHISEKPGLSEPKTAQKIRKSRYFVLHTSALKQAEVRCVLKKALPGNRGTVFYPCMECYRRDAGGKTQIRPIFPGYIFIRTDMGNVQLHEFIKKNRAGLTAFVRELGISQRKAAGEEIFADKGERKEENTFSDEDRYEEGNAFPDEGGYKEENIFPDNGADKTSSKYEGAFSDVGADGIGNEEYAFSDLTEKEAEFMDFLLDTQDTGGEICGNADAKDEKKDAPVQGLLKMSYGYREGDQYKVVEGPLRAYESHIAGVNKRDKKAYLDFEINGKVVRAGFDVMPKRHWFPEDKDTPEVLTDGTEVDLQALAKAMMG